MVDCISVRTSGIGAEMGWIEHDVVLHFFCVCSVVRVFAFKMSGAFRPPPKKSGDTFVITVRNPFPHSEAYWAAEAKRKAAAAKKRKSAGRKGAPKKKKKSPRRQTTQRRKSPRRKSPRRRSSNRRKKKK